MGMFNWDTNKQGVVLAAFFYGYITTQIPGGILAQRFGGKRLLLFGIAWTAVLTTLTPALTRIGDFPALVTTRILEGIGEVRLDFRSLEHRLKRHRRSLSQSINQSINQPINQSINQS